MNTDELKETERDEEDVFYEKIPARYRDLYDSDDFEKFTHRKDWYD